MTFELLNALMIMVITGATLVFSVVGLVFIIITTIRDSGRRNHGR